jgi:hypothetical protein
MPPKDTPARVSRQIDIAGQRFGRWTVLHRSDEYRDGGKAAWLCRCDCGHERVVNGASLRRGLSKSCGCLNSELTRTRIIRQSTTHGMTNSPEWRSWMSMLTRCYNHSDRHNFLHYGGAGIFVCDLWRYSFEDFYRDMGIRPEGTTLDRVDGQGHYCPNNCRWATATQQNRNRRNVRWLEHDGRTMTIQDWADVTGLTPAAIYQRLSHGWSVDEALTVPLTIRARG